MDFSAENSLLTKILGILKFDFLENSAYEKYVRFLPIFLIGFILSLILTPIIGQIALKYDITYKPGIKRKGRDFDNQAKALHEGITPALGGLAVTVPAFLSILLLFKLDSFTVPILIALGILIIGSALDDIFNLPAKTQMLYQLISATIIAFSVINLSTFSLGGLDFSAYTWNFSILGLQQSFVFPGDIFLILWILVCINAYKWTAGSPGIIESNSTIIFFLIFIIGVRFSSIFASTISVLMAGGLLIFLFFAFPPQKIMTGSAGKTVYGFMICVLAIIADAKFSTTIMLLIVPLIDFIYVIIKRYLTHKPKNPLDIMKFNGPDHLHHQLINLGLSRSMIVLVESSITLFLGSFAILVAGAARFFALIITASLAIGLVAFMNIYSNKKKREEEKEKSPESKYSY